MHYNGRMDMKHFKKHFTKSDWEKKKWKREIHGYSAVAS